MNPPLPHRLWFGLEGNFRETAVFVLARIGVGSLAKLHCVITLLEEPLGNFHAQSLRLGGGAVDETVEIIYPFLVDPDLRAKLPAIQRFADAVARPFEIDD